MKTQTQKTLKLERTFDATPQEMWAAWTDPAQYAKWLNPAPGIDLVIHEFDVRPGGRIRFDMPQPDGDKNPQEGVFHVLEPYTHLVSGTPDKSFLLDVRIEPHGASRCRLVVEATGVPPEFHEMATVGWGACFDKLDLTLARATPLRGQTWRIERVFQATPEDVWEAFVDEKQYAQWISPFESAAEMHEFSPRPGGRARFTMIGPKGERYPEASLMFESLDKPRELVLFEANRDRPDVFNGHPMRLHVWIEAVPGGTHLTIEQSGLPTTFPLEMAQQGFGACLDKLGRLLAR